MRPTGAHGLLSRAAVDGDCCSRRTRSPHAGSTGAGGQARKVPGGREGWSRPHAHGRGVWSLYPAGGRVRPGLRAGPDGVLSEGVRDLLACAAAGFSASKRHFSVSSVLFCSPRRAVRSVNVFRQKSLCTETLAVKRFYGSL